MGDVLSGEPQTPHSSLTLSRFRSKYARHRLHDLLAAVFLTPQGPAATKNIIQRQVDLGLSLATL